MKKKNPPGHVGCRSPAMEAAYASTASPHHCLTRIHTPHVSSSGVIRVIQAEDSGKLCEPLAASLISWIRGRRWGTTQVQEADTIM